MKNIKIYTDGSCHTQHKIGAWASIILIDNEEILLTGYELNTTHNRMELLSVIKSFEYILTEKIKYNKLILVSDSQYVIDIKDRKQKLKATNFITKKGNEIQNKDLLERLIYFIENLDIDFIKIKAHQKKTAKRNINREVDKISRKIVRDYVKKII